MKTPHNCRSPMQRQRFITAIKSVVGGKKKKDTKAELDFIVLIKLTTTTEGWGGHEKSKNPKEPQNKSKYKDNKCFP